MDPVHVVICKRCGNMTAWLGRKLPPIALGACEVVISQGGEWDTCEGELVYWGRIQVARPI